MNPSLKELPRGAKIAVVVGLVGLILIAVLVSMVAVFISGNITGPIKVANGFMKEINEDDYPGAYGYLSSRLRESTAKLEFFKKFRAIGTEIDGYYAKKLRIRNNYAEVRMEVYLTSGRDEWVFFLTRSDGEWAITKVVSRRGRIL